MNLYYESIFNEPRLAENMGIAVRDNFKKFESYLGLAIDSLKNKGRIAIQWEPANYRTDIAFKSLAKAIQLSTTVQLDIFIEHGMLDLNILGETIFDASAGIVLDNWTQLRPDEFDVYSISDKRHLIKIHNADLYRNEKMANTRNGASATITRFDLKNLKQNNKSLKLVDSSYDFDRNCYQVTVEGEVNNKDNIELNGYPIPLEQWSMAEEASGPLTDENGNELDVMYSAGNVLYLHHSVTTPKTIFLDNTPVLFTSIPILPPKEIIVDGDDIKIHKDEKGPFTYTKIDREEFVYNHPDFGFPLFDIKFEGDFTNKAKSELAILLKDDEEDDKDEVVTKSKIDYFLDQDTQELEGVHRGEKVFFEIVAAKAEEQILRIKSKNNKSLTYDDVPSELYIKVNTYQLRKQKEAITQLKLKPLNEHKPLLALSQKKATRNLWPDFPIAEVDEWNILTDATREGVDSQRQFVRQAMSTPDFSLLEGPPGSGKTTAILELILQLIKQNKRILLCASTHVAIDNVLERLKDENRLAGILPLRIGNINQIADSVKEFSIDAYKNNKYKQLMIESANLVCGTTVGILKHPLFERETADNPPVPEYDYLIIDESSKTTFQEFLIPALYAKKWVLVGDIKQLPPYTERDQIIAGLDDDKKLSPYLKAASLLIYQYVFNHSVKLPVCIVERDEVIEEIKKELQATNKSLLKKEIGIVEDSGRDTEQFFTVGNRDVLLRTTKCLAMLGADVLFIKKSILNKVKDLIPSHMVVVNNEKWESEQQHYQVNAYYDTHSRELLQALKYTRKKVRNRNYVPSDFMEEQNVFLKERTWASEYGWRMVRIFELDNVENSRSKQNYAADLALLTPKTASDMVVKELMNVHDIALPSILQSLQTGVGKNRDGSLETTLNSGFNAEEKRKRFVKLDYQHRMHEEISRFPRKQFYNNTALKNSKKVIRDRDWEYSRYPARNIWIDVDSRANRGSNSSEAAKLVQELQHFIKWAEKNPNPQHKEGIWTVACLSFYNRQQKTIRDLLRRLTGQEKHHVNFKKGNVEIANYTVDKFQGREADVTFLSMVQTDRVGFMDNPNRLNVAITRARFQRVIIGKYLFYLNNRQSEQLKLLAADSVKFTNESVVSNAHNSK
jgi:superfamily I DNA and/or RNA helicase